MSIGTTTRRLWVRLGIIVAAVGVAGVGATIVALPAHADTLHRKPCGYNGAENRYTLRADAVTRARSWKGRTPYSMEWCFANGYGDYRTDCSGMIAMAWGLGDVGDHWWTGNLDQVSTPITAAQLQPGDALLFHNRADPQDGSHVALFVAWNDSAHTQPVVVQETGSAGNTIEGVPGNFVWTTYTPVRYNRIVDGGGIGGGAGSGGGTGGGGTSGGGYAGPPQLGVLDFYLSDSQTSTYNTRPVIQYGNSPMVPIVGDWDGDGKDTVSAFDPTTARFYISNHPETGQAEYTFPYGNSGAVPLVGDWDGDGKDNVGVRMGTTFYFRTSPVTTFTETTISVAYGDGTDVPLVGDWDGDGKSNIAVYRPSQGRFYLRTTAITSATETTSVIVYGDPYAIPLVGDWNGDRKDNIGVRMAYTFYFGTSEVSSWTETTSSVAYGNGGRNEYAILGDWDGDGKDSQGIVA